MKDNNLEVRCTDCGRDLHDVIMLDKPGEQHPCPSCGSTSRTYRKTLQAQVGLSPHVSGLGTRDGESFAFRESERAGRTSSADLEDDGTASFGLKGSSPQGEEDTLETCRVLVGRLNQDGANWENPVLGSGVVDCASRDAGDPDTVLSIQVVRAITDPAFWRELNETGEVIRRNILQTTLVHLLKQAIEAKANDSSIPRGSRSDLVLALDANRLPVLGFDTVIRQARESLGTWAAELGFKSVWLVGPTPRLTCRLDVSLD